MSERALTDKCDLSRENVTLSCFKLGDPKSVLSCIFDCHYGYQEESRVYCEINEQRCPMLRNMIEEIASVELHPHHLKFRSLKIEHNKIQYKR